MEKKKDELGNTIIIDLNQVEAIEAISNKEKNNEIKETNNRFNSMEDKSDKKSKVIMILVILGIIIALILSVFLLNKYVFSKKAKSNPILIKKTELYNNMSFYNNYKDFYVDWVGVYKSEDKDISMIIYLDTDNSYVVSFYDNNSEDVHKVYNGIESYSDDSLAGKSDYLYKEKFDYYIKKNESGVEVIFINEKNKLNDKISGKYIKEDISIKSHNGLYKNINDTISVFTFDENGNSIFVINDSDKKEYKVGVSLETSIKVDDCNFYRKETGYVVRCKSTKPDELFSVINNLLFERE